MDGPSFLCKTDEVGEICVNSGATGSQYWGLQGLTNSAFRVQPLGSDGKPIGDAEYTRSGLLGFLGPVRTLYSVLCMFLQLTYTNLKFRRKVIICLFSQFQNAWT
jgi:hypothetical protein